MATFASWFGSTRFADFAVCELASPAGIDRVFDAHDCESVSEVDKAGGAFTVLCADRKYRIPAWSGFGIYPASNRATAAVSGALA